MPRGTFWSRRPSSTKALVTALSTAFVGGLLALAATRVTPFSTRSHLELASGGLDELYLTPLPEDPARVLLTTRRENSTWTRDRATQAGDPYWMRRYADPERPGLPERILLTSRSRGAHLLVPIGALDLERALSGATDGEPAAEEGVERPSLRCSLTQVYWRRSFTGLFLHLRFPKREIRAAGPEAGEPIDFDLVLVRGNELRTTDFLLQPNGELYRAALADGIAPSGPFRRNPATGDELVILLRDEPLGAGEPLYSPVSLFDELGLCWGAQLPTILDDRWRVDELPAYALRPAPPDLRARVAWNGALHLAARLEEEEERLALERALARFTDT
jgi:hypothetical protein